MKFTPFILLATLSYTANTAPVTVPSEGEVQSWGDTPLQDNLPEDERSPLRRSVNTNQTRRIGYDKQASKLEPIRISVASNGIVAPTSNTPDLTPTGLPFNSRLPYNTAEAAGKEGEWEWIVQLKSTHPDQKLTEDDLDLISKPYVQLAYFVDAKEFCSWMEQIVRADQFKYNPHEFEKQCTKIHATFKELYAKEQADFEVQQAKMKIDSEKHVIEEESSRQQFYREVFCEGPDASNQSTEPNNPVTNQQECDLKVAGLRVWFEFKESLGDGKAHELPASLITGFGHPMNITSISAGNKSNQTLHSGQPFFMRKKIDYIVDNLGQYYRAIVMSLRLSAKKNPNADHHDLYTLFGISRTSHSEDKKEFAQWLGVDKLTFPKHDNTSGHRPSRFNTTRKRLPNTLTPQIAEEVWTIKALEDEKQLSNATASSAPRRFRRKPEDNFWASMESLIGLKLCNPFKSGCWKGQ